MLVSFNGLELSDESKYMITAITGWDDIPGISDGSAARPRRQGSWPGGLQAPKRVTVIDFLVLDNPKDGNINTAALMEAKQKLALQDDENELIIDMDFGLGGAVSNSRVTALTLPITAGYFRVRSASVEFTASDPRKYSVAGYSAQTGVKTIGPGQPYPMSGTFQYASAPGAAGQVQVVNSGNAETPPEFTFRGPVNRPSVAIIDKTGRRKTTFDLNVATGETLVVRPASGEVLLNGASRYGTARGALVEDLSFRPGLSTVAFGGSGNGKLVIDWRDATI
jgi:hypothetical protein